MSSKMGCPVAYTSLMSDYIQAQQRHGVITDWTVVLINNTDDKKGIKINEDVTVGLTKRSDSETQANQYTIAKSHIIDPKHEYIDLTDEQIRSALEKSRQDATGKGKDSSRVNKPSPVRIKEIRPEKQGLLLIYLLNPQPDVKKSALSDIPFAGLAVSFPRIEKDIKIEYAVNEQFLKEVLDYPDELDEEEIDAPLVAETEEKDAEMKTFLLRKMEDKENFNKKLSLDFLEGINISYSKEYNEGETKTVAVPEQIEGSIPLIRAEDINKYYTKPYPDFQVVNAEEILTKEKSIIAPIVYTDQKFTLSEGGFVADSSCLTVQSSELALEYLLALFNSVLFAFYTKEENKENVENEENTEILIKKFPIKTDEQYNSGLISLVKSILILQKNQASRENRGISSYFMNVLDVAVFEVYFPEIFKNNRLSLLSELRDLEPFDNNTEQIKSYYQILNSPQSTVKKAVYSINTVPEFKLIYQTLSNEN